MDRLWSPWRFRYVTSGAPSSDCVFCDLGAKEPTSESLVLWHGSLNYVVLNRFPYGSGHLMIVPREHVDSLAALSAPAAAEMMEMTQLTERHLRAVYSPHGLNIGMNLGQSAGAGISAHIHLHLVPRWAGDANFMTTIGETRVMPEALETSWERLHAAFSRR